MAGQVTNGPLAGGHSQNVQRVRISSQNFLFQDFIWTARQTGVVHFFVVGHQVPIPRRKSSQEEAPLHAWVHQEVQVSERTHHIMILMPETDSFKPVKAALPSFFYLRSLTLNKF